MLHKTATLTFTTVPYLSCTIKPDVRNSCTRGVKYELSDNDGSVGPGTNQNSIFFFLTGNSRQILNS